jgi:hypothetical protein
LKYIKLVQVWLLKKRHFRIEVLWGVGILVGLLLLMKIFGRLILGTTLVSFGSILMALLVYLVLIFGIRWIEIKFRK